MCIDLSTLKNRKQIEIQTEELYISTNLDLSEATIDEIKKMEIIESLFRSRR